MQQEQNIQDHYNHGALLNSIEAAMAKMGLSKQKISIDDLGPVDEFHIGGRVATQSLTEQLHLSQNQHVLDIGCGLGGASRFVANQYGCKVSGVDLSDEYIETGRVLNEWVGLNGQIDLFQGSALSLAFEDNSFDAAYMLHVGMNIEDKQRLMKEIQRVLKPGAVFALYDVMRYQSDHINYPVPWASDSSMCHLAKLDDYKNALQKAGFEIKAVKDRKDFALEFFRKIQKKSKANGGPPALGLHTLMQQSTSKKLGNLLNNIQTGLVAPMEIISSNQ